MTEAVCASCGHHIDPAAKLCPYCTADPRTGEKVVDTQAILQEVFRPREVSTSESVIEYARQRQGIVIGISVIVMFLVLALLHQFVTRRNESTVSDVPAVPLTEVTDLSNQSAFDKPQPLPELDFGYDGNPDKMQTFVVEAGAIAPPEVVAAQQAAQQQGVAAHQPGQTQTPARPAAAPPRPPAQ